MSNNINQPTVRAHASTINPETGTRMVLIGHRKPAKCMWVEDPNGRITAALSINSPITNLNAWQRHRDADRPVQPAAETYLGLEKGFLLKRNGIFNK